MSLRHRPRACASLWAGGKHGSSGPAPQDRSVRGVVRTHAGWRCRDAIDWWCFLVVNDADACCRDGSASPVPGVTSEEVNTETDDTAHAGSAPEFSARLQ